MAGALVAITRGATKVLSQGASAQHMAAGRAANTPTAATLGLPATGSAASMVEGDVAMTRGAASQRRAAPTSARSMVAACVVRSPGAQPDQSGTQASARNTEVNHAVNILAAIVLRFLAGSVSPTAEVPGASTRSAVEAQTMGSFAGRTAAVADANTPSVARVLNTRPNTVKDTVAARDVSSLCAKRAHRAAPSFARRMAAGPGVHIRNATRALFAQTNSAASTVAGRDALPRHALC
jgi:hypothetical protein